MTECIQKIMSKCVILVDGENLVMRFQAIKNAGNKPLDVVKHKKNVYVWAPLPAIDLLIKAEIL